MNANEIDVVLIAFQKNGKNTHGRLEFLTRIFTVVFIEVSHQDTPTDHHNNSEVI